jgi:hypothetical protein
MIYLIVFMMTDSFDNTYRNKRRCWRMGCYKIYNKFISKIVFAMILGVQCMFYCIH